jgi:HPt (histidine-containing phosphotransfer) domain-containing protein
MEEKVNLKQIQDISEGDREFEEELITMYLQDTHARLNTLGELLAGENWQDLKREAHSLKGSSGNLGVVVIYDLCKELERASLEKDEPRALELVNMISESSEEVRTFFKNYLDTP